METQSLETMRMSFVRCISAVLKDHVVFKGDQRVAGVALLPIQTVAEAGCLCAWLGRERYGKSRGMLNLVGGSVVDTRSKHKKYNPTPDEVANKLFEEVYEETGFILDGPGLLEATYGILTLPYFRTISLVFVVGVADMDIGRWTAESRHRAQIQNLHMRFTELEELVMIPLLGGETQNMTTYARTALHATRRLVASTGAEHVIPMDTHALQVAHLDTDSITPSHP